jgi:hypothetical protein
LGWQVELQTVELDLDPETGDTVTACVVVHSEPSPAQPRGRHEAPPQARRGAANRGKVQRRVLEIVRAYAARNVYGVLKTDIVREARDTHGVSRSASVYEAINSLLDAGELAEHDGHISLAGDKQTAPAGDNSGFQ